MLASEDQKTLQCPAAVTWGSVTSGTQHRPTFPSTARPRLATWTAEKLAPAATASRRDAARGSPPRGPGAGRAFCPHPVDPTLPPRKGVCSCSLHCVLGREAEIWKGSRVTSNMDRLLRSQARIRWEDERLFLPRKHVNRCINNTAGPIANFHDKKRELRGQTTCSQNKKIRFEYSDPEAQRPRWLRPLTRDAHPLSAPTGNPRSPARRCPWPVPAPGATAPTPGSGSGHVSAHITVEPPARRPSRAHPLVDSLHRHLQMVQVWGGRTEPPRLGPHRARTPLCTTAMSSPRGVPDLPRTLRLYRWLSGTPPSPAPQRLPEIQSVTLRSYGAHPGELGASARPHGGPSTSPHRGLSVRTQTLS